MKNSISKNFPLFKKPLKVLFVSAEVHPYATVGGLGMVIFSLSRALKKMGVDCRIFMPKYGSIDEKKYKTEIISEIKMELAARISGREGRIIQSIKNDKQFKVALEILKDNLIYNKLLGVKN